jgi:hypothetical protein
MAAHLVETLLSAAANGAPNGCSVGPSNNGATYHSAATTFKRTTVAPAAMQPAIVMDYDTRTMAPAAMQSAIVTHHDTLARKRSPMHFALP